MLLKSRDLSDGWKRIYLLEPAANDGCGKPPTPQARVSTAFENSGGSSVSHYLESYGGPAEAAAALAAITIGLEHCPPAGSSEWTNSSLPFAAVGDYSVAVRTTLEREGVVLREFHVVAFRTGSIVSVLVFYGIGALERPSPLEPLAALSHERLTSSGY